MASEAEKKAYPLENVVAEIQMLAYDRGAVEALRGVADRIYPGPTADTIIAAIRAEADRIEKGEDEA